MRWLAPIGCVGVVLFVAGAASADSAVVPVPAVRVGMNYFDGWSDRVSNRHFDGLVRAGANGRFPGRQPLSGWRDNSPAAMRVALNWAHQDGTDFFYFDWYYHPQSVSDDPYLNTGLENYLKLNDHRGVGAALMYVNVAPFVVPASDWQQTAERWVTHTFSNPDYARVDGKPLLFILDSVRFNEQWGGTAGVNAAIGVLRETAIAHGLPGVFVVGSIFVGTCVDRVGWDYFAAMIKGENWDALTQHAYPAAACERDGPQPYSDLVAAGEASWDRYAASFSPPTIPEVMVGWDPRPWDERADGHLWWFQRTPAQFRSFVEDAASWAHAHPIAASQNPSPIVLVTAWNEIGEGEAVIPSQDDGYAYGQALAQAVGLPRFDPTRETLSTTVTRGGIVKGQPTILSCARHCQTTVDYGRQVILTAVPKTGFAFQGWTGACKARTRSCSFLIEHDTSVYARFARKETHKGGSRS